MKLAIPEAGLGRRFRGLMRVMKTSRNGVFPEVTFYCLGLTGVK